MYNNISTSERIFRGQTERKLRFTTMDDEESDLITAAQVSIVMNNTRLTFPSTRTCLVYDLRMTNHTNHIDR